MDNLFGLDADSPMEQILERFYALDRAGRPDAARLIAVSKTVGVDETVAAIRRGIAILPRIARGSWFASSQVWRSIRSCPRCASI